MIILIPRTIMTIMVADFTEQNGFADQLLGCYLVMRDLMERVGRESHPSAVEYMSLFGNGWYPCPPLAVQSPESLQIPMSDEHTSNINVYCCD
jgi:hypothetical protein